MEEQRPSDNLLVLEDELILEVESGGEDAIENEPGVLLLRTELTPEPVIRKIEVGPRVAGFSLTGIEKDRAVHAEFSKAWSVSQPSQLAGDPVLREAHPFAVARTIAPLAARANAQLARRVSSSANLARVLSEARAFASDYGAMKARTRQGLYEALGRTYDFTIRADEQPEEYARLIEDAGLTVQGRAPYSPIIKLVFGTEYDKTRVAEFAAAIAYGRRKCLPIGGFNAFLEHVEGGLKAVVGLERLFRKGESGPSEPKSLVEARPAIARKLREIRPTAWIDLPDHGDEFTLLVARRLSDGSMAMVGEVPRDIGLLERAARRLLAELDHVANRPAETVPNYPEEV